MADARIEELRELNAELLDALKYCRRFLSKRDHDTDYLDTMIAKAEKLK